MIVVPILPDRLERLGYTNISTLTGWLMFTFCIGVVLASLPIAHYFHRCTYRRGPLVASVLVLELALVLFMLVKHFWAMVIARFLQGAASAVIWSIGFVLICENVPEKQAGRHIGFAVSGVSIGSVIAPPIGGALYTSSGWNAVFILCIAICAIEIPARLLVFEQRLLSQFDKEDCSLNQLSSTPHDQSLNGTTVVDESTLAVRRPKQEIQEIQVLSPWAILNKMLRSARGLTGLLLVMLYGLVVGAFDPTLTLRVQSVWDKAPSFVGLVYLAAAVPTILSGPVSGILADRFGAEMVVAPILILLLPWLALLTLDSSLPGFIVYFALTELLASCMMTLSGVEVAILARETEGVGEIHQFAALNVCYSISGAIGPVIGGQLYAHARHGWSAVCWFTFASCLAIVPTAIAFTGNRSLWDRVRGRIKGVMSDVNGMIRSSEKART